MSTGNKLVDQISLLPISGSVIPNEWFHMPEFKHPNGKVNLLSILILSDILYWYRRTEILDEETGETIAFKKKFLADKLQRSYDKIANKFGCSKYQATAACHFLQEKGLISLEFRTLYKKAKPAEILATNVLFIAPIFEEVEKLFNRDHAQFLEGDTPMDYDILPQLIGRGYPSQLVHPPPMDWDTNTKINTKNNTKSKKPCVQKTHADSGEEMNAKNILVKVKNRENLKTPVGVKWKKANSLIKEGYQPQLTMKELGQLKKLEKALGERTDEVISWCVENWSKFSSFAEASAGLYKRPVEPHIGFLLTHHKYAVNYIDSIQKPVPLKKEPTPTPEVKKTVRVHEEHVPYRPTPEEFEELQRQIDAED